MPKLRKRKRMLTPEQQNLQNRDEQIILLVSRNPIMPLEYARKEILPRVKPRTARIILLLLRCRVPKATSAERRTARKFETWNIERIKGGWPKITGVRRFLEMQLLAHMAYKGKVSWKDAKPLIERTSDSRVARIAWLIIGRKVAGVTERDRRDAATCRAWGKEQRARDKEEELRRRYSTGGTTYGLRDDPPSYGSPMYVLVPIDRYH